MRRRGIPLEVCLTSNVQTGVVPALEAHPARRYHLAGVPVSLSTDNRLMSAVNLLDEYGAARDVLGFTWPELVDVARTGFRYAFADEDTRQALLERFDDEVEAMGGG